MKKYCILIILFSNVLVLNAQNFEFNYERGKRCSNKISKRDSAIIYFTRAIQQDSTRSEAYIERARLFDGTGKLSEALIDYNKVILMDSLNGRAYQGRANIYMKTCQKDKELNDYRKAIELLPDDEKTYYSYINYGIYFLDNNGNMDSALYYINKAIGLTNKYKYYTGSSCYNLRGKAFLKKEEYEKAIADFTTAINLGFYSDSYLLRSKAYEKLGLKKEAQQDLKEYEKIRKNNKRIRKPGAI